MPAMPENNGLPPGPPPLLHEYHPCNPKFLRNGTPYIKVNVQGEFDRRADARPAVPDPNNPGCYILAPGGGKRHRKTRRHRRHSRHTKRRYRR